MRFDDLFDDLEGQLEQELHAEEADLEVEEERLRLGRLGLRDRLVALCRERSSGAVTTLRLELGGGTVVVVRPTTFGRDWVAGDLIDGSPWHPQCVVPLGAVASVVLDRGQVDPSLRPAPASAARLVDRIGLPYVLRDLGRRRSAVELVTVNGSLHGTIDRVGRDHLDLAVHEAGTPRRERAVRQYRLVPFDQVRLVRVAG
ncbi:MAG: hypothetical protein ABWY36_00250 [Leifsonia sp.]